MKICPKCFVKQEDEAAVCGCGEDLRGVAVTQVNPVSLESAASLPTLAVVLRIVGWLHLVAAAILAVAAGQGEDSLRWWSVGYWIGAGVGALVWFALASALELLQRIAARVEKQD